MALTLICVGIALWALYMGATFYRHADWDEPAESTPDFGQMTKKQAQLQNVEDVLREAVGEGKLSKEAFEEVIRYSEAEIARMQDLKTEWDRKKRAPPPVPGN